MSGTIFSEAVNNHVQHIVGHFHAQPECVERMAKHGELLQATLHVSANNSSRLDEMALELGKEGGFWEQFKASTYHPDFFQAWCEAACFPANRDILRPVLERGADDTSAWLVVHFREYLRDGYKAEDAARFLGKEIGKELEKGNVWIVTALAESVRKPPRRTLNDWLIKGWLTLTLWRKAKRSAPTAERNLIAETKRDNVKVVHAMMKEMDAELVPLPNDAAITNAIATVASRLRHRRR